MKKNIELRVYEEAKCLCENFYTIREVAKIFGVSKSTVHNDIMFRLKSIDSKLYELSRRILNYNYEVKHIRGGEATKRKYQQR